MYRSHGNYPEQRLKFILFLVCVYVYLYASNFATLNNTRFILLHEYINPMTPIVQAALVSIFRLFAYFTSSPFADETCGTSRLLGRMESCLKKYSEEFFRTVCSHLPRFDPSPVCLGALRGRPPSGSAKQPLVRKKVIQLKRERIFFPGS